MAIATKTSPEKLSLAAKRSKVIELRLAGKTMEDIAQATGLAGDSSVRYHINEWLASIQPTSEQTEELRHLMSERLEKLHAAHWEDAIAGDTKATEMVLKLMDRKARLMGLDLTTSHLTINVTAEGLAAALGFDDQVIDVEASSVEEITDGSS